MQRGDVAGDAVDGEPGAGLPDPVGGGVGGEGVVEPEGAADGEGAVGDVVDLAGGPLLLAVVDEQGADLERGGLVGFGVGGGVGLGVRDSAVRAERDGVDLWGRRRGAVAARETWITPVERTPERRMRRVAVRCGRGVRLKR